MYSDALPCYEHNLYAMSRKPFRVRDSEFLLSAVVDFKWPTGVDKADSQWCLRSPSLSNASKILDDAPSSPNILFADRNFRFISRELVFTNSKVGTIS